MKAAIYKKHEEIDLDYIINLAYKIEVEKISNVNLVIVERDLFYKLLDEVKKMAVEMGADVVTMGIKLRHFRIISSEQIEKEIHLTFKDV